jgi:hypothetical protein
MKKLIGALTALSMLAAVGCAHGDRGRGGAGEAGGERERHVDETLDTREPGVVGPGTSIPEGTQRDDRLGEEPGIGGTGTDVEPYPEDEPLFGDPYEPGMGGTGTDVEPYPEDDPLFGDPYGPGTGGTGADPTYPEDGPLYDDPLYDETFEDTDPHLGPGGTGTIRHPDQQPGTGGAGTLDDLEPGMEAGPQDDLDVGLEDETEQPGTGGAGTDPRNERRTTQPGSLEPSEDEEDLDTRPLW